ncbi:hypothetical protein L7F22_026582 [Adiantum nelumboides]|nr:hypothetical protein [Adiantum nelumboides]
MQGHGKDHQSVYCYPPDYKVITEDHTLHASDDDDGTLKLHKDGHDPFLVTVFRRWPCFLQAFLPACEIPSVFSNSPLHFGEMDRSWQARASVIIINLLHSVSRPFRTVDSALEWLLNFLPFNGGILRTASLLAVGRWDLVTWSPPKDSPSYFSVVGWLDTRLDLLDPAADLKETNTKSFVDLCVMASKLSYESPYVQRKVVENNWKVNTLLSYSTHNRAQRNTTEAFIFTNKPQNANLIMVAFRGTEPLDTDDWSIDFDFSWLELDPTVGKIHIGFLEALGLVNRNQCQTFDNFKHNCLKRALATPTPYHHRHHRTSGLIDMQQGEEQVGEKTLAFDAVNKELGRLLKKNPETRICLTGHSLGGALALAFIGILMLKRGRDATEEMILEKVSAIHTFGQPRIGDKVFAEFLNNQMEAYNIAYYRIVYSNDMISRIPSDNKIFGFKHTGKVCHYYDVLFSEKAIKEVPNKNFFSPISALAMWITGVWELLRSIFLMTLTYGVGFKETTFMVLLRVFGLVCPGLLAHMPVNYVNATRLGPDVLIQCLDKGLD